MGKHIRLFSRNLSSSWLSLVLTSACQMIMVPLALSALGKTNFALYAVISQLLMAVMLAELGVSSACSRLLIEATAEGNSAYRKMWTATTAMFVVQAIIIMLITLAISPFLKTILKLDQASAATATAIFITVGLINAANYALGCIASCLYAGQQLAGMNIISSFTQIIQLAIFAVSLHLGAGLWSYPIALGCSSLLSQLCYAHIALKRGLLIIPRFELLDWACIRSTFSLGRDVFIAALFSMAMGNSLLIFSGHILTMTDTAVLAVHLKLAGLMINILQRIPGSADPMYMKMVSEGHIEQFQKWWKFVTKSTIGITLMAGGCFIICCKQVIAFWVGPEMLMPSLTVIALALIPTRFLMHYMFVAELAVFKQVGKVKWQMAWEVSLYAALAYFLGTKYGLVGLIIANLTSMLGGSFIGGFYWFSKYSRITWEEMTMICIRPMIPIILCFYLLYRIIPSIDSANLIWTVIHMAIWISCCVMITYTLVLTRDDKILFRQRLDFMNS